MFACLASDYARGPFAAQPDLLGDAERRHAAGEIDDVALAAAQDAFVRDVIGEQERAGLSMVTDGGGRWTDPLEPILRGLSGVAAGGLVPSFEPGLTVRQPVVEGPIAWREPIFVPAYEFAAGCSSLPVKQVVTGPYTIGRLSGLTGAARTAATLAIAEALNEELRQLVMAGCLVIQVEEDGAAAIGDDEAERSLFRDAHRRLVADLENPELVHLALGVSGGSAAEAGAATLFDRPYSSYFFDLLAGPANWQLVLQAPFDRGIVCGVADARSTAMDDAETIVYAIAYAAAANDRGSTRVGIAPSGSLRGMERHYARRKIERLAMSIGVAGAGPVVDVAEALEPHPTENPRFPDLQRLARGYQAARAAMGLPEEWRKAATG